MVITGLIVILVLVLLLPFVCKKVEKNLELFLLTMGIIAAFISGKMGQLLIIQALKEPILIACAVLIIGILFFVTKKQFQYAMGIILTKLPLSIVVFGIILLLGLISSVITAIIASLILVEVIYQLPVARQNKIVICILACYSIGLGAVLTPIGEPLATIAISKLGQDFLFLLTLLGKYIIPLVFIVALAAGGYTAYITKVNNHAVDNVMALTSEPDMQEKLSEELTDETEAEKDEDTWHSIIFRAVKVYMFVMALVFLGEGFEPLINAYILGLAPEILYWVNMISAVLDNATLCAAEVSPAMLTNPLALKAILMGLLVSGGMLIPGNIPNIIAASKLHMGSKEWASYGIPMGLVLLVLCYVAIFVFGF